MLSTEEVSKLINFPCSIYELGGISDGLLLKTKRFYVKMYDDEHSDGFVIQGYHYGEAKPVFVDSVPYRQIQTYMKNICLRFQGSYYW